MAGPRNRPLIEMTIPTMYDPTLAPEGRHIMGIFLQYAPYTLKDSNWDRERIRYTERILDVIEEYCPNIRSIIEHKQTLDAARSGAPLRHHRRQYFSRRNVAGPDVRAAAPGRLGQLSDAGPRPVFVRLRRASRWRSDGRSRSQRRAGDPEGRVGRAGFAILRACCRPFLLVLCESLWLYAADPPQKTFPFPYTQEDLPNGLRLVTIPTDSPNLVSVYIVVQTGSRNEVEPGKTGFAHLFEHMMFRGTDAYPPAKVRRGAQARRRGLERRHQQRSHHLSHHVFEGRSCPRSLPWKPTALSI